MYSEASEERRAAFLKRLRRVPKNKRVYIDEMGISIFLTRLFAYAFRGQPVYDKVRGRLYDRLNVIGALWSGRHIGVKCYRHSTDSAFFEAWFLELLYEIPKSCTIIMDNASFHRKKQLRKLARGHVRLLFLPPYSPDFNKIEKSWANAKSHLRNHLRDPQTLEEAILDYFKNENN